MEASNRKMGTVLDKLTPDESQTVLRFAEFLIQRRQGAVDARAARRRVSAWLVRDVGNLLMRGEAEYVPGEQAVWRVPVLITHGRQGRAASVDVDAQTGDLLITQDTPQQVLTRVQAFIAGSA